MHPTLALSLTLPLAFAALAPATALARTLSVRSGGSIRDALARARPGDRIEVHPGIYHEGAPTDPYAVTVTTPGIEIVGHPAPGRPVVLENAGGQSFGMWVSPPDSAARDAGGPAADPETPPCAFSGSMLAGFALSGFTLRGFQRHGLHLACVDGFAIRGNVVVASGEYGIFPILSRNGLVAENDVATARTDAALYVGQSDGVTVSGNVVYDSLIGIEVQNSRDVRVLGNHVHDNTLGLLIDVDVGKIRNAQDGASVAGNFIHDNNRPTTAEPDDLLAILPPGIGVLLSGGDHTVIRGNVVTRNGFVGIGATSLRLGLELAGLPSEDLEVDPDPDHDRIADNVVEGNGGTIVTGTALDALRADLFWDGSGSDDCWQDNRYGVSLPAALPSCR